MPLNLSSLTQQTLSALHWLVGGLGFLGWGTQADIFHFDTCFHITIADLLPRRRASSKVCNSNETLLLENGVCHLLFHQSKQVLCHSQLRGGARKCTPAMSPEGVKPDCLVLMITRNTQALGRSRLSWPQFLYPQNEHNHFARIPCYEAP